MHETSGKWRRKLLLSVQERNVSSVDGVVNVSDGIVDDWRGGVTILSGKRRGASLAWSKPIKVESYKHVNWPHFTVASQAGGALAAISLFN